MLPATLPIVLYNGRYRWKAPTSLRQMMRFEPDEALSKHSPALRFLLIDADALAPDTLDHMHNACAQLLRLEQPDDPEALIEHAARLAQLIHTALPQSVREELAIWFSELLLSAEDEPALRAQVEACPETPPEER